MMKHFPFFLLVLLFQIPAAGAQNALDDPDIRFDCPILDIAANDSNLFVATACGLFRLPKGQSVWQKNGDLPRGGVDFLTAFGRNVVAVQHIATTDANLASDSLRFFKSRDFGGHFFLKTEMALNAVPVSRDSNAISEWNQVGRLSQLSETQLFLAGKHTVSNVSPAYSNFAGCFSSDGGETWHWQRMPNPAGGNVTGDFPCVLAAGDSFEIFTHDRFFATRDLSRRPNLFSETKFLSGQIQTAMLRFGQQIAVAFSDGSIATTTDGLRWVTEKLDIGQIADLVFSDGSFYCPTSAGFFRGAFSEGRFRFAPAAILPLPLESVGKAVPLKNGNWFLLSEGRGLLLDGKTGETTLVW